MYFLFVILTIITVKYFKIDTYSYILFSPNYLSFFYGNLFYININIYKKFYWFIMFVALMYKGMKLTINMSDMTKQLC